VIDAARLLKDRNDIVFRFVGHGTEVERLKVRIDELKLSNVVFASAVPLNRMKYEFEKADALLVHLMKRELFEITIPSKIQAYLYGGKPILCGVSGNAADLVLRANAGITFEPENPQSLVDGVMQMTRLKLDELQQMGQNGHDFYMKNLQFETAMNKMNDFFFQVMEEKKPCVNI